MNLPPNYAPPQGKRVTVVTLRLQVTTPDGTDDATLTDLVDTLVLDNEFVDRCEWVDMEDVT